MKRDYVMVRVIFLVLCFLLGMGGPAFAAEAPKKAAAPAGLIPSSYKEFNIGDVKIKFGADDRIRYENRQDFKFGDATTPGNDDGLWYNRFRINMNVAYQNFTAFVEGLQNDDWHDEIKPAKQRDELDLHQAYLKLSKPGNLPVSLKVGRQKLSYGAQRLIAAPVWSNNIRSFDAIRFTYNPASFDIDFFVGTEVIYENNKFNDSRWGKYLYGVYVTYKGIPGNVFDLYSINVTDEHDDLSQIQTYTSKTAPKRYYRDIKRYTIGTRGEGKIASTNFGYGYEFAYQFGDQDAEVTTGNMKSQDIRAWAAHADVNYAFKGIFSQPVIKLEYNYATGDSDPANGTSKTFDPLFQTRHGPYGLIDFIRWQNMVEYAVFLDFTPIKDRVKGSLQYHRYYLDETNDAWYGTGGTKMRYNAKSKNASDYLGDEVDMVLNYKVFSFLELEGGYAHFFSGDYIKDTVTGATKSADADWFYLQTVITF